MATTAGVLPLADLILHAQEEADRVGSSYHSPSELAFYANQSAREYYDILTQKYGEDYILDPTKNILTFPTVVSGGIGQEFYPLPDDFYKLALVVASPDPSLRIRLMVPPFNLPEVPQLSFPGVVALPYSGIAPFRHRLAGDRIWFLPPPTTTQFIMVYWYPRFTDLVSSGQISMAGCGAGDTVTVNGRTFTAVSGSPGTDQFQVAADGGAANLQALLAASYVSLGLQSVGLAPGSSVVQLNIYNSAVQWSATGNIALSPNRASWTDQLDGVSGWTEYVIVDMAIKMMGKEESDTSLLERRKAGLVARLQRMASHRDASVARHVVRTRNQQLGYPGNAGNFPYGGW